VAQGARAASLIALSVHGPAGVLDLVVPGGASVDDVAQEYAAQTGSRDLPPLHTSLGERLAPGVVLADARLTSGDILVAATPGSPGIAVTGPAARAGAGGGARPDRFPAAWFAVAAGLGALAGGWGAGLDTGPVRSWLVALLVAAALLGAAPVGRSAGPRAVASPAFGGAAAWVLAFDPHPERLPLALGAAGLGAALTAALARALTEEAEEGLRVWLVTGVSLFLLPAAVALAGWSATVAWALLLVAAMLAARFVPAFAVDVPDQLLIDLERLAVTAWSARERPRGRRGRAVASPRAVEAVARHGARLVTAACVAIAVVATVSAAMLLGSVELGLDRIGARSLVFFAGAALLLAGRSYRHAAARAFLRLAGLGCWTLVLGELLLADAVDPRIVAAVSCVLAVPVLVAAVVTGRGWRSVWWARRAEVAEGLSGAAALASVLVASGLFRVVWELGSRIGR
jgi:hypothetical protein